MRPSSIKAEAMTGEMSEATEPLDCWKGITTLQPYKNLTKTLQQNPS